MRNQYSAPFGRLKRTVRRSKQWQTETYNDVLDKSHRFWVSVTRKS